MNRLSNMNIEGVIGTTLIGLMVSAAWFLGLSPLLQAHAEERAQAERIVSLRQAYDLAERRSAEEQERANRLQAEVEAFALQPMSDASINGFLERLIELADDAGILIERISPGDPQPAESWTDVPVDLVGTCGAERFRVFLAELRQRIPEAAVRSFTIDRQSDNTLGLRLGLVWRTSTTLSDGSASG